MDSGFVYWAGIDWNGLGSVMKVSASGGSPVQLAASHSWSGEFVALAVGANAVYWSNGGSIMMVAK